MYSTKSTSLSSVHEMKILDEKLSRSFTVVLALAGTGVALMVAEVRGRACVLMPCRAARAQTARGGGLI